MKPHLSGVISWHCLNATFNCNSYPLKRPVCLSSNQRISLIWPQCENILYISSSFTRSSRLPMKTVVLSRGLVCWAACTSEELVISQEGRRNAMPNLLRGGLSFGICLCCSFFHLAAACAFIRDLLLNSKFTRRPKISIPFLLKASAAYAGSSNSIKPKLQAD